MTTLLEQAFTKAAKLPPEEQDLLASWLLAEMEAEDAFDRKIVSTAHKMAGLAAAALAEYDAGLTEELRPEQL